MAVTPNCFWTFWVLFTVCRFVVFINFHNTKSFQVTDHVTKNRSFMIIISRFFTNRSTAQPVKYIITQSGAFDHLD